MKDSKFIIKKIMQIIIYLGIFALICAVFAKIDSKQSYVNVLELIFLCIYMLVGSMYILKDCFSRDAKSRKDIKKEKEDVEKFNKYLDILNEFNYEYSSLENKFKYLIASLYEASVTFQMSDFYARARDFSRIEIKDILYNKIDYEFDEFIDNVIMKFAESMSVSFFKTRIINIISKEVGIVTNENYYYDMTYNFRGSIVESNGKYNVVKEAFKNNKWEVVQIEKGFLTDDEAYLDVTRIINVINDQLRNNLLDEFKDSTVDEDVFKLLAHTYKVLYQGVNGEAAIFRLYYIIKNYGLKEYIKCLKNDKEDVEALINAYPNLKEELVLISTKRIGKKRIEFVEKVILEKIEPYINDYIKDDSYNIQK